MLKDRIAVATSPSDVQSINRMTDDLIQALVMRGFSPTQFDAQNPIEWAGLASRGFNTVICYGGGIAMAAQVAPVLKGINILMVSLDHPAYWIEEFRHFQATHMGQVSFTVPTQSNVDFVQALIPGARVRCLRHSANVVEAPPMERRTGSILLVGNYTPEDAMIEAVAKFKTQAIEALSTLTVQTASALEEAVAPHFADPYGAESEPFIWLCGMVDRIMRARTRRSSLLALAGHPVEVIGRGWEALDLPKSFTLLGEMNARDVVDRFGTSRIVVNTMPYYVESHERLYEAAAHGAALLTAHTDYNATLFGSCGRFFKTESEVGDLCSLMLKDKDGLEAQSMAGLVLIDQREGWPHRVSEVLEILEGTPNQSLNRHYDLILDLIHTNGSLNLSPDHLAQANDILITIHPSQMPIVGQIFAQAGGMLPQNCTVSVVTDRLVPSTYFDEMAHVLGANGYEPSAPEFRAEYGGLTVRKV